MRRSRGRFHLAYNELVTLTLEPGLELSESVATNRQTEVDAAWAETTARRLHEIETGKVQLVSFDETTAIAKAMIRDWRQ